MLGFFAFKKRHWLLPWLEESTTSLRKKLEFMWPSNSYSSYEKKQKKKSPPKKLIVFAITFKTHLGEAILQFKWDCFFVEDKAQLITNTTPAAKPCGDSIPCFTGKVKTQIKGGVGKFKRGESQGLPYYLNPVLFCWTSNTCFYSIILILNLTISSQKYSCDYFAFSWFFSPSCYGWRWLALIVVGCDTCTASAVWSAVVDLYP